jgi:hypothetical protein
VTLQLSRNKPEKIRTLSTAPLASLALSSSTYGISADIVVEFERSQTKEKIKTTPTRIINGKKSLL